jgi:hypothetical protein
LGHLRDPTTLVEDYGFAGFEQGADWPRCVSERREPA